MSLHQLVYISDRSETMDDTELRAVVEAASVKNAVNGITGLLLCAGGHFIQALEGELQAINPLFEKISTDPRHSNVRRLLQRSAEFRLFPEWGMKLTDTRAMPLDQERIDRTLICIRLGSNDEQSIAALQLLNEFRLQLMSQAA